MSKTKLLSGAIAVLLITGAAGVALASAGKDDESQEVRAVAQAKVSMTDAIRTAEQQAGGRAVDASFDDESGHALYEVEVLNGATVHNVYVDAQTGKVAKVTQGDQGDNDEERGERE